MKASENGRSRARYACALLLAAVWSMTGAAWAAESSQYGVSATLDGAQQVPPVTTTATGSALSSYDPATGRLGLTIAANGILPASLTGAHIHLGAKEATGAVIVDLGTAGWVATTSGAKLSTNVVLPKAYEADLLGGNTYVNLHTSAYPGGEIRGQIVVSASLVGIDYAMLYAASADGSVAVGARNNGADFEAIRWTAAGGVQSLGIPPNAAQLCNDDVCGTSAVASAVSADGKVIAVNVITVAGPPTGRETFRWTEETGYVSLGTYFDLYPFGTSATTLSADGSTVVGGGVSSSDDAFRWTAAGGLVQLPNLPSESGGLARGMSGDGDVIVGTSGLKAVKWPAGGGVVDLGLLPGAARGSAGSASFDGSIIAGCSDTGTATQLRAVRWIGSNPPALLPAMKDEYSSCAQDITPDGTTIAGQVGLNPSLGLGYTAFLWTEQTGKRQLAEILAERGVDLTTWKLNGAYALSADAATVVGYGFRDSVPVSFVAHLNTAVAPLPPPPPELRADMALEMSASSALVKRFSTLTYRLTVKNNGPDGAQGVTVTDTLPASMSFVSATATLGTCSGTSTVTCALGPVPSGGSASVTIVVRPQRTGIISNTAAVASDLADANTANNTKTVSVLVY